VGQDVRREVVHHLHVGDQGGSGVDALEEIVREEGVFRDAALQGRRERVDDVQPLAREDALVVEILVGVRDGRGVGVDPRVPRVDPREERAGGARERDAHARLQDSVPRRDAAQAGIEMRAVQRMLDDSDQVGRGVARQARVGVQRDDVAHLLEDRTVADHDVERGVRGAAQQGVELLDLPAFSLPAHPHALPRVPLPRPMEQVETIPPPVSVARVEGLDALD